MVRREKMKVALRIKATKEWRRGRNKDLTASELDAFTAGFNMGWKSLKKFLRKRVEKKEERKG